ncbi:hypothetical protein DWW20_20765, partial [Ruminococcus sp. AF14-5]
PAKAATASATMNISINTISLADIPFFFFFLRLLSFAPIFWFFFIFFFFAIPRLFRVYQAGAVLFLPDGQARSRLL